MSDYNFSNITIFDSNCGINLTVRDSGSIQNVNFSNISIETRMHTGDWWGNGEPIHISAIRGKDSVKLGIMRNITVVVEDETYQRAQVVAAQRDATGLARAQVHPLPAHLHALVALSLLGLLELRDGLDVLAPAFEIHRSTLPPCSAMLRHPEDGALSPTVDEPEVVA
jgi:hypothetical protein